MTDRELMRQALEALEANPAEFHDEWGSPGNGRRAVEILQHKAIVALRERLEQPEQEPVAWRAYTPTNGYTLHHHYGEAYRLASKIEPLYAAPPVCQPLTDAR